MPVPSQSERDAIVVGSGFGGAMVASALVRAGARVLLLERGGWVPRGDPARDDVLGFFQWTEAYSRESSYLVRQGGRPVEEGICACVGGPSVFYGGASFRFRDGDFAPPPEIADGSDAAWPLAYMDLEPWYTRAERLLGVAGESGRDPTEPPRSGEFPQPPAPLAPVSQRIWSAAEALGLHPFRIPLALNHTPAAGAVCSRCTTCDAYACWSGAKNDLATRVIEPLLASGLALLTGRVVTRLVEEGGRIVAVEAVDRASGSLERHSAPRVVLAAGALASAHLLLASGLERRSPAGGHVGRHLMRHCNAFVYGVFPREPNPERLHHKQVAVHDFYFGDPAAERLGPKLGNIQQIMAPQTGAAVRWLHAFGERGAWLRGPLAAGVRRVAGRMTGLQVIAEDQPRHVNRLVLGRGRDPYGLPRAEVHHRYTARDVAARRALARRASQILRRAGAVATFAYPVTTFSHAVGTVRMGEDPATAPLDRECRFRGVENLRVVDGSFMPFSAGVNPSLTIAANALRVGEQMARE